MVLLRASKQSCASVVSGPEKNGGAKKSLPKTHLRPEGGGFLAGEVGFFGDIYRLFFWDSDFFCKMVDLYRYLSCWFVGVIFVHFFVTGQKIR